MKNMKNMKNKKIKIFLLNFRFVFFIEHFFLSHIEVLTSKRIDLGVEQTIEHITAVYFCFIYNLIEFCLAIIYLVSSFIKFVSFIAILYHSNN